MDNHTCCDPKEFLISMHEMKRRKVAFISLEVSLFLSVCLSLFDIIMSGVVIAVPVMIFFAVVFILLALRFNKVHESQACYRVYLSDKELELNVKDSSDKYLLNDIKSVRIKRTYKGFIREMRFGINTGKIFYLE